MGGVTTSGHVGNINNGPECVIIETNSGKEVLMLIVSSAGLDVADLLRLNVHDLIRRAR